MDNVINFDFSSEKIRELVEKTKERCIQICQDCGHRFKEDTAEIGKEGIKLKCPKCGSEKVKVELK